MYAHYDLQEQSGSHQPRNLEGLVLVDTHNQGTPNEPQTSEITGIRRLLYEPARPKFIASRPNAFWFAVITVCFGAFMGQLDASIVTLAFPTLEHSFNTTSSAVTWVGLAYLLTLVALLPAVGRYADMIGRKLLYTYGFILFIIGSALCALAPNLDILILFRIIQAIGAAMLQANSVAIIANATPTNKLGRAIGIQGSAQALGLALGPAVGGFLISIGGWQLIFIVNVPVGIIATVLAWFLVPRSRHLTERSAFDWTGLIIFTPTVIALMLALSYGNQFGWLSTKIIALFIICIVGAIVFIARERKAKSPMVNLGFFRQGNFSAGVGSGLLIYLVIFGILYVVPYYLERGTGLSSAQAGLELLVMPLAIGICAPIAGRVADKTGAKPLMIGGMALTTIMLISLGIHHSSGALFLIQLALVGAGLGASTAPNNAATMGALPRSVSGIASGILNMSRGLGTAMGLALTALVFTLIAGEQATHPSLVKSGFGDAAFFLAAIAFLTFIISVFRPSGQLSSDPTAQVE